MPAGHDHSRNGQAIQGRLALGDVALMSWNTHMLADSGQQGAWMFNAKSILDKVMGSLNDATGPGGAKGLGDKARETWDSQSTLTKGALAGGLLGVLLTGGGRKMLGTGMKVGGAALIGGLAYKAYEDWKAGKSVAQAEGPVALPNPAGTAFLPADSDAADDLSTRILQAMIAAAKADGHITVDERSRINAQLDNLGLGNEATAMIAAELDKPLDVSRVAALAHSEEEATQIYAASLLVVDPNGAPEKHYLAELAATLKLDAGLVSHLHMRAAEV
jgi:uncharacterized membrane protein YebE (DUF533 family)